MKKPASILAVLLAIAIVVAGVFGVQKSNVSTELTNMTADRDAISAELKTANAKISEQETAAAAAAADLEAANAKVTELEAAATTAAVDLEAANAKVAELEAAAVTAAADLEAANAKVAELEAAAATAAADLAAAKADAETAAAKIAELEAAAVTAAADLVAANAKVDEIAAVLEFANSDLAAANAKIAELEEAVAAYEAAEAILEAVAEVVEEPEVEAEPVAETEVEAEPEVAAEAEAVVVEDPDLKNAKSYLYYMYRNQPASTPVDYTVIGGVPIGGAMYTIDWSADSDTIKFFVGEDTMVNVDVDDKNPKEVVYQLTATITSPVNGQTATISFERKVPAALILEGLSYEEIVAAAYTLEAGLALEEPQRLFGTVTSIDTAWNPDYKNITVTIQIGELADQPIQCYRLAGEGAENLQVGDQITVEGIIKNYKGTIEFDAGCKLVGFGEIISQQAILDAAYALEDGAAMPMSTALRGVIIEIPTAYNPDYKNLTVNMVCDGQTEQWIQCYRLSGEGAENLQVGDEIGVAGIIKNYKGTIEFDKGCVLIPVDLVDDVRTVYSAYTLEDGMAMTKPATLTGVITEIPSAYSPDYKNITVNMVIAGLADNWIQCYRLSGEGAETLEVGDTITVTGTLKNYKGTYEFDKGCTLDAVVKAQ